MKINDLFSGVAVIIDDKIDDEKSGDLIFKIRDKLKSNNIPLLEYKDIPDDEIIGKFNNVSFILLDWELFDRPEGLYFDDTPFINRNIDFIKRIKETTFVPIFVFSKLDSNAIIRKLVDEKLYAEDSNNYIFVKKKDDLISEKNDKIFTEIENWLKNTPSIYVLKKWEQALNKAKRDLFWSFYKVNHNWPSVLQKTFKADGSDVNYELGNFIFKNIMARTEPIEFDEEILKLEDDQITKEDIRNVLEAERFIKKGLPDIPFTGDLFEFLDFEINNGSKKEKKRYYLNIRPDCDIIRDKDTKKGSIYKVNEKKYNPQLYCLECDVVKSRDIELKNGVITERINSAYIPFVYGGKIFKISFDRLRIFRWKEYLFDKDGNETDSNFKSKKIGRILHPYITRIQQKYAFYLQRQGLPAIPAKAISE